MIDLQRDLVATPAIAPESGGEGESKKGKVLIDWLHRLGLGSTEVLNAPDKRVPSESRPNIVATIAGCEQDFQFWIMTHLDVVPPGDESLWQTSPFNLVEKEGKLYGRGTEDNHHGLVASIFAASSILEEGLVPQPTVKLLFVSDEEVGSAKGIRYLLDRHTLFGKEDYILVPDMGSPNGGMIEIAEKSILWLKFEVLGKQCHASTPQKGINAFVGGSDLVVRLNDLNRQFKQSDRLFDIPVSTFSPTKKEANIPNINTIPAEDIFYMDCRVLPSVDLEDVLDQIRAISAEIEREHGVRVKHSVMHRERSKPTSRDAPIVSSLRHAVKEVYDIDARPVGVGGGTVAAYLRNAGYQTAVWAKLDTTAHTPNEYCVLDNLVGDAKVMARIMMADRLR
jgi:succinyl-diaminopimelate desuccinylase